MAGEEFVPFKPGTSHVPDYYRMKARELAGDQVVEIDLFSLLELNDFHPLVAFAIKYLLRAGRKPGEAFGKDLAKAMEALQRLVRSG